MKKIILTALIFSVGIGLYARTNHEQTNARVVFVTDAPKRVMAMESSSEEVRQAKAPEPTPEPTATPIRKAPIAPAALVLPDQESVAAKIRSVFTQEPETAVAIFRAESGLRPNAQGWNCHYYNAAGVRYSAACQPEDRGNAWSVDCGVAQINTPGRVCPAELFDIETNLEKAKAKYTARGWQPWSAYNAGKHLAFLK